MERNSQRNSDPNVQSDSDGVREALYRDFVNSYARLRSYECYRNHVGSLHNIPTSVDHRFPAPDVAGIDCNFGFNTRPYGSQNEPPLQESGSRNHAIPSYTCPICPANAVDSNLIMSQSNVGQNHHPIPDFSGGGGGGGGGGIFDFYNRQQIPSSNNEFYPPAAPNFMAHTDGVQYQQPISDFGFLVGGGGSASGTYSYPSHPTPSSTNTLSHVNEVDSYNFKTRSNGLPVQPPVSEFGGSAGGGGSDINSHYRIWTNGLPIQQPISDFGGSAGGGGGGSDINSQYWIPSSNSTLHPPPASDFRTRSDIDLQYQQQPFSNFGFVGGDSHGGASNFHPKHQIPSANNTLHSMQEPPPSSYRRTTLHDTLPHDSINPTSNTMQAMIRAIRPVGFIDQNGIYQRTEEFFTNRLYRQLDDGVIQNELHLRQEQLFSLIAENEEDYLSTGAGISEEDWFSDEDCVSTGTGLSEETISKHLKTRTYNFPARTDDDEPEICVVCQAECEEQERIASLLCGHGYHADCVKEWLLRKNFCPICKATALIV